MKKLFLTTTIILTMAFGAMAQQTGGGLFSRGYVSDEAYNNGYSRANNGLLALPGQHGLEDDVPAPVGSGIAVLVGLGAAYLVGKRRKE